MMSSPHYTIEGGTFVELIEGLVYLMKLENETNASLPGAPQIREAKYVLLDGSHVKVRLSKREKDPAARRRVEIDGARLG